MTRSRRVLAPLENGDPRVMRPGRAREIRYQGISERSARCLMARSHMIRMSALPG